MLSLGAAAFMADGELAGTFSRNLVPLKGARQHPDQMAFWLAYPEAFRFATLDPVPPDRAMREYDESVQDIASNRNARPVFVAYPAGLDWTFVYWYLMRFVKESPFGFQALDTKSFAMAVLGTEFTRTKKGRFPNSEVVGQKSKAGAHEGNGKPTQGRLVGLERDDA